MIYFLLIIDILINNYTKYTSFFFLIFLYNKPYKYYLITALILDFLIFNTYFQNSIILSILYFINTSFNDLNKNNIYSFLFISLFNYIFYIILANIFPFFDLKNILEVIGYNLIINMFFYYLAFPLIKNRQIN